MTRPPKIEVNTGGKLITSHPFKPRDPERSYWSACEVCGMYLAAHSSSSVPNQPIAERAVPEVPVEEIKSPLCICAEMRHGTAIHPSCPIHGENGEPTDDEKHEIKNGMSD